MTSDGNYVERRGSIEAWRNSTGHGWLQKGSNIEGKIHGEWQKCTVLNVDGEGGATVMDGMDPIKLTAGNIRDSGVTTNDSSPAMTPPQLEISPFKSRETLPLFHRLGPRYSQSSFGENLPTMPILQVTPVTPSATPKLTPTTAPLNGGKICEIPQPIRLARKETTDQSNDDSVTELRLTGSPRGSSNHLDPGSPPAMNLLGAGRSSMCSRGSVKKARIVTDRGSPAMSDLTFMRSINDMTFNTFSGETLRDSQRDLGPMWSPPLGRFHDKEGKLRTKQHLHRAVGRGRSCGHETEDIDRDESLRTQSIAIAVVSSVGLVSAMFLLSLTRNDSGGDASPAQVPLQFFGSTTTLLTVILIIRFHLVALRFDKSRNPNISFIGGERGWSDVTVRGRLVPLLIEVTIHLIYPVPYYSHSRWGLHIICVTVLRLYTTLRAYALNTPGYRYRFDIVNQKHLNGRFIEAEIGWHTAIRTTLVRHTFTFFSIVMLLALLTCALLIYFAEREAQPESFDTFHNSVYFTFVTFTTVGYGDIAPVTNLGKALTVMGAVVGVIITNLFAAILTVKYQPTPVDTEVLKYIERLESAKIRYMTSLRLCQLYHRDRQKAVKNGIWYDYVAGKKGIMSLLELETVRAVVLSKQARLRMLEVGGNSVADRDHMVSRTHSLVQRQGREMKKLWTRLKTMSTLLARLKNEIHDSEGSRTRKDLQNVSTSQKIFDSVVRGDQRKGIVDTQMIGLLTEIAETVQSLKPQPVPQSSQTFQQTMLTTPDVMLAEQNSLSQVPPQPQRRSPSPFRCISPSPSVASLNRTEDPISPLTQSDKLSAVHAKIMAMSLQQRTQTQAIDSLSDRLQGIEDAMRQLAGGMSLEVFLGYGNRKVEEKKKKKKKNRN